MWSINFDKDGAATLLENTAEPIKAFGSCNSYPIASEEKDNKRTIAYNIAGIKIKCDKIFKNKSKSTYLHFYGEGKVLDEKISFDQELFIDTDTYDKYDWYVNNGILYVVLFEKINEQPKFERVEKPKKEENKESSK